MALSDIASKLAAARTRRWALPSQNRALNAMTFLTLVLLEATILYTGNGFPTIQAGGDYASCLLAFGPLAAGAFLFGPGLSLALGLFSGFMISVQQQIMPLDSSASFFFADASTYVVVPACAVILSLLFGIVVKHTRFGQKRRAFGIIATCIAMAIIAPPTLLVVAFASFNIPFLTPGEILMQLEAAGGNAIGQAAFNAACMVAFSVFSDAAAHWWGEGDDRPLARVFGAWTFLVVVNTFLLLSTVSCFYITSRCEESATTFLENECTIALEQLKSGGASPEDFDSRIVGENGRMLIGVDDAIESSPDPRGIGSSFKRTISIGLGARYRDVLKSERATIAINWLSDVSGPPTRSFIVVKQERADDGTLYQVGAFVPDTEVYENRADYLSWQLLSSAIVFALLYGLVMLIVRRLVSESVRDANDILARIAAGDLNARLDIKGSAEFHHLSRGINKTVESLQMALQKVKEGFEREMGIARAIQEEALPRDFDLSRAAPGVGVFADMCAAREVGGDFYDFFPLGTSDGSQRLAFVIADVSGKGVPAALFMMAAKAEIKNRLLSGTDLTDAVAAANEQLCADSHGNLFVTAFVGVLDCATGRVECVNAGHNPPLRRTENGWSYVRERSGVFLGAFEGAPYRTFSLDLAAGDALLLYTDGVTEAMNVRNEELGEDRLLKIVDASATDDPTDLAETVKREVFAWETGCEQSDDVTVLAIRYDGSSETEKRGNDKMSGEREPVVHRLGTMHLEVPATTESLTHALEAIERHLQASGCPGKARNQIAVCVEELFVNVASYAYDDGTAIERRTVELQMESGPTADGRSASTLIVTDAGRPFDPLAAIDPTLALNIEDAGIGGLGIFMAKKIADDMSYERVDGLNVLKLVKYW